MAEVNKLNLPSSPCNDDPTYNFLSCVMKSVASKAQKNIKSVLTFKTSNNLLTRGPLGEGGGGQGGMTL